MFRDRIAMPYCFKINHSVSYKHEYVSMNISFECMHINACLIVRLL